MGTSNDERALAVADHKKQKKYRCKGCMRPNMKLEDFQRSNRAKTGYLSICRKCQAQNITRGRALAKAKRAALAGDSRATHPKDVEVKQINTALKAANSPEPGFALLTGFTRALRSGIKELAAHGVSLDSVKVEGQKLKAVYRIEEEIDL